MEITIIKDEPNTLANIASCCFPLAGLILYLVCKDTKPQSASIVCKCAIGGVVDIVLVYAFLFGIGLLSGFFFAKINISLALIIS